MPAKSNKISPEIQAKMYTLGRENSTQTIMLHDAIGQKVGLTATDIKCLGFFDQGQSFTAGEIANLSGLTTGSVTTLLDRLEKRGAIRRSSDPNDRRKVIVTANPAFLKKVWPFYARLAKLTDDLLAPYSAEEQKVIADFMERMNAGIKKTIEEIRATKL